MVTGWRIATPRIWSKTRYCSRRHAGRAGGQLAHAQESAHLIAQLGKRLVVDRAGEDPRATRSMHHEVSLS